MIVKVSKQVFRDSEKLMYHPSYGMRLKDRANERGKLIIRGRLRSYKWYQNQTQISVGHVWTHTNMGYDLGM